jgi:Zn-finger protein
MEKPIDEAIEPIDEIDDDGILEYTTREEYITSCFYALNSIGEYDTGIMSKTDGNRIKSIRKKCLIILDSLIDEMYDELFNQETDDSE